MILAAEAADRELLFEQNAARGSAASRSLRATIVARLPRGVNTLKQPFFSQCRDANEIAGKPFRYAPRKGGRPELNRRPPEPQSGALTN